jgi:CheY-like chemotaxis protein
MVLVVDDEDTVRDLAATTLRRFGYSVIVAENGQVATDILRAHRSEIDVVILDLTMPVMSGEETLVALRRIREDVPLILSSGFAQDHAVVPFSGLTLSGFLQKPYTATQLLECVSAALAATTRTCS